MHIFVISRITNRLMFQIKDIYKKYELELLTP